jgi:SOS-response transcriptional repressor LexA
MDTRQQTRFGLALRLARLKAGIEQERLADHAGVSQPTVSRWERGRGVPAPEQLDALLKLLDRDGEVAELARTIAHGNGRASAALLDSRLDALLRHFLGRDGAHYDDSVPFYADIAAGLGEFQPGLTEPKGSLPVPGNIYSRDPTCYGMRVIGDSMEPLICPGDVLVISPASSVVDGCIVAACVEPEGDVVKRYRELRDGRIALQSFNPKYADIVLEPGDGRTARIWGRVIMQQREL